MSLQDSRAIPDRGHTPAKCPRFNTCLQVIPASCVPRCGALNRSGGRGESHPPAPTEPDVSLSTHPAPIIQRYYTPHTAQ